MHGENGGHAANGTNGNGHIEHMNGNSHMAPTKPAIEQPLPREWDDEAINDILEQVARGASLRSCTRGPDMRIPETSFRRWLIADIRGLWGRYARAREMQLESWADEIKELADVCEVGTRREINPDGGVKVIEGDMIDRAKLRIDARKWLMSKLAPKKYGDHAETNIAIDQRKTVFVFDPMRASRAVAEHEAAIPRVSG